MKIPSFASAGGMPRLLATTAVLALCGCATVAQAPTQSHKPDSVNVSPGKAGTISFTGEDLKLTGRTNTGEALRAVSPIFH